MSVASSGKARLHGFASRASCLTIALTFAGTSLAAPPDAGAAQAELLREKREWVRQVERGDYFFWQRFFDRLDDPREFPKPPGWYQPSEPIVGEPSAALSVRSPEQRRLSDAAIAALRAHLEPRRTGAFYVMQGGEVDFRSFDADTHPGSLLPVRSLTKVLSALLIGVAIEEGTIAGLDAPIGKYLAEWTQDPRGAVTVRQLLAMTSGLENPAIRPEPDNKALQLAEGSDVHATALSFHAAGAPGASWSFNNVDTQLLGMVLERATRRRFADYLSEKIWRPMGLDTATLNLDGKAGNARVFCCMRARASDWLKLGYMMMHGGRWQGRKILPAGWMQTLLAPVPSNPKVGSHLLLGWNPGEPRPAAPFPRYREPFRVPGVFFMAGGISITLWMIPARDMVIFRWGDDPPDWDSSTVPNMVLDGWREPSGRRAAKNSDKRRLR